MDHLWLVFALLSAATAALVAIFGKIGLQGIDANTATAVRAVIMALFLIGVVVFQGTLKDIPAILADRKAITFIALSGVAGATSAGVLPVLPLMENGRTQTSGAAGR